MKKEKVRFHNWTAMDILNIARTAHNVNKAFCEGLGDTSQPSWNDAPDWQRTSGIKGVLFHRDNPDAPPSASHDAWMTDKVADGWVYGPEKDAEAKTDPCMVSFEDLPLAQQTKYILFSAVVAAFATSQDEHAPQAVWERHPKKQHDNTVLAGGTCRFDFSSANSTIMAATPQASVYVVWEKQHEKEITALAFDTMEAAIDHAESRVLKNAEVDDGVWRDGGCWEVRIEEIAKGDDK